MPPRISVVLILLVLVALVRADIVVPPGDPPDAVRPADVIMLNEALEKTAADLNRWAYTETRLIRDPKGRVKTETVVRYDPSKPYAEQYTPILINGQPPSGSDRAKYRRQGERAQRQKDRGAGSDPRRVSLGELLAVPGARVVSETARHATFEIPLRPDRNKRFPPEKFEVLARIDKASRTVENITLRLREAFRTRVVVSVKAGGGVLDFTEVDPKHPPTLTSIRGDATASVLFVSVGGELDLTRTDLKRVKPYDERFDVQIGPLRAIDF
jgi:hypothetical protein